MSECPFCLIARGEGREGCAVCMEMWSKLDQSNKAIGIGYWLKPIIGQYDEHIADAPLLEEDDVKPVYAIGVDVGVGDRAVYVMSKVEDPANFDCAPVNDGADEPIIAEKR